MNTLENNKLIAEFMGWVDMGEKVHPNWVHPDESSILFIKNFMYHSSWDWLMPVVEKINAIDIGRRVKGAKLVNDIQYEVGLVEREDAYEAVIKFVTWYNKSNISNE